MARTDDAVSALAHRKHGVFSLSDLAAIGVGRAARRHRLEQGRWIQVYDGVYAIAGPPLSWHGRLLAACLAGGPNAVASHRAAAALRGFPAMPLEPLEITCPRWRRHHTTALVVHETLTHEGRGDAALIDRVPVTSAERTLLDLGAVVQASVVEIALDFALRKQLVTIPSVRRCLDDVGRRGRNGTGVLRSIVVQRAPDQRPAESPQETRLLRLLRRQGFVGFVPQHEVRHRGRFVARVDIAFPDALIALEYDSFQEHLGSAALVRDSARRNALVAAGWTVVTATARDLELGGNALVTSLRTALRTRS